MTDFHAAPDSWLRKQLKWAVTFQRGHDLPDDAREEGPVPVYAGGGITGWHNESCAAPPGIVTGRYGTIGEFHLVSTPYWPLNTALYSIDLHSNNPEYLRYLLEFLSPLFHVHAGKSAVPGVDRNDIHTIPVALPGQEQQRRIAAFLGGETRRIDGLLAAKRCVLDLLAEKRKAIIATAVTHGLDPKVKLRDSGVPWLGEIPVHWNVTRLKFIARVQTGIALGKSYTEPTTEYAYLRVANVQDGFIDLTEVKALAVPEREAASAALRKGDVLMNEGGDADKLGRGAIWDGSISPCLHQNHVFALRPESVSSEWLSTWTGIGFARAYFETRAKQSTNLASISSTNLLELPIAIPPDDEQSAIVAHIARETAKLDAVRAATESTIALLKERRSALIAAAVTGQLDVGAAG